MRFLTMIPPLLSGRFFSVAVCLLLSTSLHGQTAAPAASVPAKYDTNGNGRLDPDEERVMRADEAKAARLPSENAAAGDEVMELTPFEVRESNNGYLATNTMSGTRLNTKLEDLGSSISVVTKQQMTDFAMLDINDIFAYEGGTEGTGNYTEFSVDRNGMVGDSIQANPQGANRIRGIGSANISVNGLSTSGRVPIDPIDVDSVEISRGPNSSIFGLGDASGTVNLVSSSATIDKEFSRTQFRVDDREGWRTSLDLNRTLLKGKLAGRVSAVYQHDGFVRKPSGFDSKRFNAMIRAKPFKYTTLRASYQTYRGSGTRATTMTPRDGVTDWITQGSPTWDPVTSTVTVNGVSTPMGAVNPNGLADQNRPYPVIFVGNQGIDIWTIGRLPAATATNGPNNTAGVGRLLETVPEPLRTGRPLFSTLPGVESKDVYDYSSINLAAPNFLRDAVNTATIDLEQYLLDTEKHKIAFQFSWQRENAERYSDNVIGSTSATGGSYYLFVDPNSRLLDGRPNPYFKQTYVGVPEPTSTSTPYDRETYRAQLAYIVDLTRSDSKWLKWAGRHQLLGYYEQRETARYVYRFRDVMISDNPIYAPAGLPKGNQSATGAFPASPQATRAYYHYYVGDNNGYNVDYGPATASTGNYTFGWFNPQTGSWVYDTNTIGTAGITEGSAGSAASLNLIKTKGGMMQNYLFGDRLVLTWGRRNDESYSKRQNSPALLADGYTFNYAAMDGWSNDWTLQSGDTKTSGAVLKPFRDWKFLDRSRAEGGLKGFVANALNSLSLFYNKSDSFIPLSPAYNVGREELGNTTSLGEDYGFALNFGRTLSFRASHYTTNQINARNGQNASLANRMLQLDLNNYGGSARVIPLQRQATAWVTQLNPGFSSDQVKSEVLKIMQWQPDWEEFYRTHTMSETQGIAASGDEFELTYNPSSFWTLKANATRSEAIDAGIAQSVFDWYTMRVPIWESIIDPRTGTKWLDTGYAGDLPSPGSGTPRSALLATLIELPITLARATEGTSRPQIRKWRFNVSTSYRLAGISDHKILKKMSVGGAVRWESKAAIGYYGVPVDGDINAAITLDANRPIYDKANTYFDGFVTYSTKMFRDKIQARFQLNVRNIQESKARLQAVGAYPNGEAHTFRIIDPRTFILTASFDL